MSEKNEDQIINDFFQEMKRIDQNRSAPAFEEVLNETKYRPFRPWTYSIAASIALLLVASWFFLSKQLEPSVDDQQADIIITIGTEQEEELAVEYEWPSIDNWSSETDILLTGL